MTHRSSHSNDDATARIDRPQTLEELNAAYLRDNPDASATTPRREHTATTREEELRKAVEAARESGNAEALQTASDALQRELRERAKV